MLELGRDVGQRNQDESAEVEERMRAWAAELGVVPGDDRRRSVDRDGGAGGGDWPAEVGWNGVGDAGDLMLPSR